MADNTGGEVLFDAPLEVSVPLEELWSEASPYRPHPLQSSRRLRFHEPTGLILRSHNRIDYQTELEADEVLSMEDRIKLVEGHFNVLQNFGIAIVRHTTQLVGNRVPGNDYIAYSASRCVPEGRRLDHKDVRNSISRDKVERLVIEPLQAYYRQCRKAGATLILSDVYDPHQYSQDSASGTVYLHDVDPRLIKPPGKTRHGEDIELEMMLEDIAVSFEGIGR